MTKTQLYFSLCFFLKAFSREKYGDLSLTSAGFNEPLNRTAMAVLSSDLSILASTARAGEQRISAAQAQLALNVSALSQQSQGLEASVAISIETEAVRATASENGYTQVCKLEIA